MRQFGKAEGRLHRQRVLLLTGPVPQAERLYPPDRASSLLRGSRMFGLQAKNETAINSQAVR